MVLIVVTDGYPVVALKRLISRMSFVLFPTSVLLIKYYGDLGRAYTVDGKQTNIGVTTDKNTFGVILLVLSLGTLWQVIDLLRSRGRADRGRHLLAQSILLTFGIVLLGIADSKTSVAGFILGAVLILATGMRTIRIRPARVHALCLALVLAAGVTFLFGGQAVVIDSLGRNSSLSGRTDIWAAVIPTAPNSIVGAGFEGYWISPSAEQLWRSLALAGWWHPELLVPEAHNGYIEVYLNLGWVGVGLISVILISGYRHSVAAFRLNPSVGSLALAYVIVSAVYSVTEAGFRSPNPMWILMLLAVVSSTGIAAGPFGDRVTRERAHSSNSSSMASARTTWAYRGGSVG
jgi:O-antigen ligase